MKQAYLVLLMGALAGCTTHQSALPSVDGKPRVQINQPGPPPAASKQSPLQE